MCELLEIHRLHAESSVGSGFALRSEAVPKLRRLDRGRQQEVLRTVVSQEPVALRHNPLPFQHLGTIMKTQSRSPRLHLAAMAFLALTRALGCGRTTSGESDVDGGDRDPTR